MHIAKKSIIIYYKKRGKTKIKLTTIGLVPSLKTIFEKFN